MHSVPALGRLSLPVAISTRLPVCKRTMDGFVFLRVCLCVVQRLSVHSAVLMTLCVCARTLLSVPMMSVWYSAPLC